MWNWAVDLINKAVTSAFGWLGSILDAAPGAWSSLLTIFVILAVSRYLLAPIVGFSIGAGSDQVADFTVRKGKEINVNRTRSTTGLWKIAAANRGKRK